MLCDVNATVESGLEEFARAKEKVNQCLEAYSRECQRLIEEIGAGSRSDAEERFDDSLISLAGYRRRGLSLISM
jgi:hypothetical protein